MDRRQFLSGIARSVAVSAAMVYAPAAVPRTRVADSGYGMFYAECSIGYRGPLWVERQLVPSPYTYPSEVQ